MEPTCERPGCDVTADYCCDLCNRYFCSDHGTKGGDRQGFSGLEAYPSRCWECGGFDGGVEDEKC